MNSVNKFGFCTDMIIINCSSNNTLQDLKIKNCAGVFTYNGSDDLLSITSNRYIVWQTFDDMLKLSEYCLNRDLHYNEFQIQFKNSLILENGVTIHETADKIIILVTTIVSVHRLVFKHPNQMFSNPIGSHSSVGPMLNLKDSPCYSIFYNASFSDLNPHFIPLHNSFSQNSILGSPAILPYLATCSFIDKNLDAYFILSTNSCTLNILKMPINFDSKSEVKIQNLDLKQSNLIGKLFNGFVPSIMNKTPATGTEAAVYLLPYDTPDDTLIFALSRDCRIRVISLKQQNLLIIHSLPNQCHKDNKDSTDNTQMISSQIPVSMKFWWYEDETCYPNLVIYTTDSRYNRFYFYQFVMPNANSPMKNNSLTFNSSQQNAEPHLRHLFQKLIPNHYEMIDYFVSNSQLWAMWQHNEIVNLQYYSIDTNYEMEQPFEWMPVIADVNAYPDIGLRSPFVNPREYYLNEIFWRGNFSLKTIAKAIMVLNRSVGQENISTTKIDLLIHEAIKLIDSIIRDQADTKLEMSVKEYIQLESDSWDKLLQFCLDYHVTENEPMSIFVDSKTGVKGIVRKSRLEFIPKLNRFDDMINHYFLYCKQNNSLVQQEKQNGHVSGLSCNSNNRFDNLDLFSISAFEYRLNTLIQPIQNSVNQKSDMFSIIENMKSSILVLLHGMSAVNGTLKDEDLLDFEAFMQRMSNVCFSTDSKLSLADVTKKITEDTLLPEIPSLSDNTLSPLIDDFFEKCPYVVEAIKFFILQISFIFLSENEINDCFEMNNETLFLFSASNENAQLKMQDALQFEIKPIFTNLLSSRCGLDFTVTSITRIIQLRYKFCRDLFLFQYMLTNFHSKVKNDYKSKIIQDVQTFMIPCTSQLLFALNHLNWICKAPMITPNIWWSTTDLQHGITSIVNLNNTSVKNTTNRGSSFENSELLSVLEMRDYINLNRVGILSHENIFYDAYPRANILYFFIQFSGGILTKRLLSYTLTWEFNQGTLDQSTLTGDGIWTNLMPSYMNSVCQLLWPFSSGQFKLAEFLLGVGQYQLVERYVDKLHSWCMMFSYSRYFAKGICYLMTGEGDKAITQFKQSIFGINSEPFLFKLFHQKPKLIKTKENHEIINEENGDEETTDSENLLQNSPIRQQNESNKNSFFNARTIFRYYNKLIQLFNRYSTPDYVIELANCAIKSLEAETDPEYEQHSSALHSILFACHLRLGNNKQAYKSMIDNLDNDQKQNCLRQFIVNLCETGKFKELVNYSYINLEDNFVAILESKARSSCIQKNIDSRISNGKCRKLLNETEKAPINYYYILYSYFMNTFNYRQAAQAIYDYYRQLSQEFNANETMLKLQANALLIARNCLKCLEGTKYSWIVKNSIKKTDHNDKNQLKRKRGYFSEDEYNNYKQEKTIIEIVDVDELLREHELINARLKLLERNAKEYAIAATPLCPDEIVILLVSASLYEQAFKISELFNLNLEPIFEGMTSKFVQLLHGSYNRRRIDSEMFALIGESNLEDQSLHPFDSSKQKLVDDDNFTVELLDVFYENTSSKADWDFICYSSLSICDRMWYMIMYYLRIYQRYPTVSTKYFKTVTEKLLSNGIMIPISLIKIYKKSNCAELIRLLITYNFLSEATQISLDYMNAFMGHGNEYFDLKNHLYPNCPPLCIPVHLFDCLINVLTEEHQQQKLMTKSSDAWQKNSQTGVNGDNDDNSCGAVDDILEFEPIDYETLIENLTNAKQRLEKTIITCSNI